MRGIKKFVSLAIIAVLLLSVPVLFTACDDPNNNDPKPGYFVTINVDETKGSILVSPQKDEYEEGEEINIKVVPNSGYELMSFYIDNNNLTDTMLQSEDGYNLQLYRNRELRAMFQDEGTRANADYKYKINVTGYKFIEGEVSLNPARSAYKEGESVTVSVKANTGYQFKEISVDGVDHTTDATVSSGQYSYTFEIGDSDVNVSIKFTADLSRVITVTDETFDKEVTDFEGVVLIDCWAEWCEWCKKLSPFVDQIAKAGLGIKVVRIETDIDATPKKNPRCISMFNVSSLPLLVIYKDGKMKTKSPGLTEYSYNALYNFVKPYLN